MKKSNVSLLLLKFLPLQNKRIYLMDINGFALEAMARRLGLSIEAAIELRQTTRIITKRLTLILLQTNNNDFPIPAKKADALKEALIYHSIILGRKKLEEVNKEGQDAEEIIETCKKTVFHKLFPEG